MTIEERIDSALAAIRQRTSAAPEMGLILGSGLGDFCDRLEDRIEVPFDQLPGFPLPTVEGHAGAFVFGTCRGRSLAALRGRIHYYEGYTQQELTLPVRVMARLGVKTVILTNAAGGVNLDYKPGTLMLISDHINFSGNNPLAARADIPLREGVYTMYSGPSYETPAEIRMFRTLGGDAVGMSTVPEAIAARHAGLQVLGVSCITNMAAGILSQPLSHAEVVETASRVKAEFTRLLELMIDVG